MIGRLVYPRQRAFLGPFSNRTDANLKGAIHRDIQTADRNRGLAWAPGQRMEVPLQLPHVMGLVRCCW